MNISIVRVGIDGSWLWVDGHFSWWVGIGKGIFCVAEGVFGHFLWVDRSELRYFMGGWG